MMVRNCFVQRREKQTNMDIMTPIWRRAVQCNAVQFRGCRDCCDTRSHTSGAAAVVHRTFALSSRAQHRTSRPFSVCKVHTVVRSERCGGKDRFGDALAINPSSRRRRRATMCDNVRRRRSRWLLDAIGSCSRVCVCLMCVFTNSSHVGRCPCKPSRTYCCVFTFTDIGGTPKRRTYRRQSVCSEERGMNELFVK